MGGTEREREREPTAGELSTEGKKREKKIEEAGPRFRVTRARWAPAVRRGAAKIVQVQLTSFWSTRSRHLDRESLLGKRLLERRARADFVGPSVSGHRSQEQSAYRSISRNLLR